VKADRQASRYLSLIPSRTLLLDNHAVHYVCMGQGRPVILVHGGGMWLYTFRHNLSELSRHFRVYALDMPGYGYTEPVGSPVHTGLHTMSATLLSFMDSLGISSAVLVGHSWGGGWALHFASLHPERVDGLVLEDSSGLSVRDVLEWELLKVPVLGSLLLRWITVGAVEKRLGRSYFRPGMVTRDMAMEVYLPLKLAHNRRAQVMISRSQDWRETEQSLPGISRPALVLWGDHDRYLDAGLASRFELALPRARTFVFRDCGHSPHEEQPGLANRVMEAFIREEVPEAR
jgi:pimeloyl-ACP methyl ester carboxylesterase